MADVTERFSDFISTAPDVTHGVNGKLPIIQNGVTHSVTFNDMLTNQAITLSGDINGSGTTSIPTTLPSINPNVGSFNGIVVNGKGQVIGAADQGFLKFVDAQATYLRLDGGTIFGNLHVNSVDSTNVVIINGTTKSVRFTFEPTRARIEAADQTGVGSYQPMAIGGSTVTIQNSGATVVSVAPGNVTITGDLNTTGNIKFNGTYLYMAGGTGTVGGVGTTFIFSDGVNIAPHLGAAGTFWIQNSTGANMFACDTNGLVKANSGYAIGSSVNPQFRAATNYTVMSANDTIALDRVISVGNLSDPTNYHRNTNHMISDQTGSNVVLNIQGVASQQFGGGGVVCGTPTGGAKGAGTLNAQTVYGNNVVLTSDANLKTDIQPMPECLELLKAVQPRAFRWNPVPEPEPIPGPDGTVMKLAGEVPPEFTTQRNWGFLAQDLMNAPGVHRRGADGIESVDVGGLVAVLWKVVQELTEKVERLEAR